ncbi:serine/threonine protein phosphatase [Ktedonospora formicarum]|uniref:Serine/threonine protein phosphatase n=2 Tax=Ktedonospora formicarum TaxID=2778364 RepID=A0A8J3MRN5_9CHLR|nr:serine/threonine protein phosphatase [Ktedonospora formicarum]
MEIEQVILPPPVMVENAPPSRQGMTYAIGDIHGEVTLLRRLFEILPLREEDTLVFLGDCLNRGEDSVGTIYALRDLKQQHPACIFLRGNHEDKWLECWDGARFTHAPKSKSARRLWRHYQGKIPFAVGDWLEETRIDYEDKYAYYAHAGALPGHPYASTSDKEKMWGVEGFLESEYDWGKPIVCGHWGLIDPLIKPNLICVDTRACRGGMLTAIRLPDRKLFQVQHTYNTSHKHKHQKARMKQVK